MTEELLQWGEERALARHTDPETSHDAAKNIKVSAKEEIVLECLAIYGPQTSIEIANRTGLNPNTVTPRMKPLKEKGKVYDTGIRRKSKLLHQCPCCSQKSTIRVSRPKIVWAIELNPQPNK
jgi:DNA-binding CsgD family transcriptional regulator